MIEQLTSMMVASGATWVLWVLIGLSVVSLGVALERLWAFRVIDSGASGRVSELRSLLRAGDDRAVERWLADRPGPASEVVRAGLAEVDLGPEAAEEAMAAAIGLWRAKLSRGLLFLGTVGNNAPFVGLLGTVIGVVGAFDALGTPQALSGAMAASASLAPERVMGTIAEALVATAVGLLVAIPAVAVFNYFQGRLTAALADAQTLGHVLLVHVRGAAGPMHAWSGSASEEATRARAAE